MPKRLSGTSCLSRALPSTVQPIWITDAVLADSFRRFTHVIRRHGSNVPGPLEARRRASKRRNTSLAHAGGGAAPVDPANLFPTRPQNPWWQKQPELDVSSSPSILPRWLLPPSEPPTRPQLAQHESNARTDIAGRVGHEQSVQPNLESEFQNCGSVEDVHKLLAGRAINLRQDPVTNSLFISLLPRWTTPKIGEYLTDPELNPPGTNNHIRLMRWIGQLSSAKNSPWRTLKDRKILLDALCRAITLGLLNPQHIEEIITILPELKVKRESLDSTLPTEDKVLEMVCLILRSIRDSGVLSVQDLSHALRESLLSKAAASPLSKASVGILGLARGPTSLDGNRDAADAIVGWLSKTDESEDLSTSRIIAYYLRSFDPTSLTQTLSNVTENLFLRVRKDYQHLATFTTWKESLESLYASGIAEVFLDELEVGSFATRFSPQITPTKAALLSWWMTNVIQYDRNLEDLYSNLRFLLTTALQQEGKVDILDWLDVVNKTLQYLPIPNWRGVLFKIVCEMKEVVLARATTKSHSVLGAGDMTKLLERLSDDTFYVSAKDNFLHELMRMCEFITSDLRQFVNFVHALTEHGDIDRLKVVYRSIKHNRIFQLGLRQARFNKDEWQEVLVTDAIAIVRQNIAPGFLRDLHSTQARHLPAAKVLLNVIDHIAVAFATNPHDSAQTAYNRVRWLWRFLRRHRLSPGTIISRCLWHAGVSRRGREGCSTTQLKWIVQGVERHEGGSVVRLLMTNSGFRVHRKEALEAISKKSKAETQHPGDPAGTQEEKESAQSAEGRENWSSQTSPEKPFHVQEASDLAEEPEQLRESAPATDETIDQPDLADTIDRLVRGDAAGLGPADMSALDSLPQWSSLRAQNEESLEEQKASLQRLLETQNAGLDKLLKQAHQSSEPSVEERLEWVPMQGPAEAKDESPMKAQADVLMRAERVRGTSWMFEDA